MIAHLCRPLLTFAFRVVPSVWRAWKDSRAEFVSPTWISEQKRSRVI